jgi:hypothetical protein
MMFIVKIASSAGTLLLMAFSWNSAMIAFEALRGQIVAMKQPAEPLHGNRPCTRCGVGRGLMVFRSSLI